MMDTQTLFTQALAAIKAKKNGEAQKLLTEVVRQNPRHEQAWLALASVLADMKQAADCLDVMPPLELSYRLHGKC